MTPASEFGFPVDRSHVVLYARSVGDLDAGYPGAAGVIADPAIPPTFFASDAIFDPDAAGRQRPSGSAVPVGQRGAIAAEAHFEYHRPVRLGEHLTVRKRPGATWEKSGRTGGTMTFTETITEFRDGAGDLVVTMRRVAVRTSRPAVSEPVTESTT